jgi:hypothetical protein
MFQKMGEDWGIREERGDPTSDEEGYAWIDESKYYFIKVTNEPELDTDLQRRTLVLDNLIHGYFVLGHPERLDYDYEHIYALVAYRAAKGSRKITLDPNSPPTTRRLKAKGGGPLPDPVFAIDDKAKASPGANEMALD